MKIFFDTEFTGLHKKTTLLSIGLIDENGRSFYGEFTDYDRSQINDWLKENVIYHMFTHGFYKEDWNNGKSNEMRCNGSTWYIRQQLEKWIIDGNYDNIELISDVCHYDMVLFIDIWGNAFDIPKCINPACHDINQDIAKFYNITETEAFDFSREKIISDYRYLVVGDKHNALYDAKVIQAIYTIIQQNKEGRT